MQSFVDEAQVPSKQVHDLTLSGKFFDRIEEAKIEAMMPGEAEEEEPQKPKGHELLLQFWNDPEDSFSYLREKVYEVMAPGKYEYLMKVCALLSSGESNFEGTLELSRMKLALSYIESSLQLEEIWLLAETSQTGEISTDDPSQKIKMIKFQAFFRALRRSLPELSDLYK